MLMEIIVWATLSTLIKAAAITSKEQSGYVPQLPASVEILPSPEASEFRQLFKPPFASASASASAGFGTSEHPEINIDGLHFAETLKHSDKSGSLVNALIGYGPHVTVIYLMTSGTSSPALASAAPVVATPKKLPTFIPLGSDETYGYPPYYSKSYRSYPTVIYTKPDLID